jgi:Phosphoribosylglycinamide synthetase, ATP-grasp (A) domain
MTQIARPNFHRVFVIVDAFRSGSYLPLAFLAHGVECVHVQSTVAPAFKTGHYGGPYLAEIVNTDVNETVALLRRFDILAVVAGSEPGVELADLLNEALGTNFGNGTTLSSARRDKFEMRAHALRNNLRSPRYQSFSDPAVATRWVESQALEQVIVKPPRSAGAQGIKVCRGAAIASEHVRELLSGRSLFGEQNNRVLVEEYVEGEVFIVNAASHLQHFVSDVWRCKKSVTAEGYIVFEHMDSVSADDTQARVVVEFAKRVLDAFGVRYGPSHTELLLDSAGDCWLVEVAARMHGNLDLSMTVPVTGSNQVLAAVQSYLAPKLLEAHEAAWGATAVRCRAMDLIAPRSGSLREKLDLTVVKELESFWSARIVVDAGDEVQATADLMTSLGSVVLVDEDFARLQADWKAVRAWEAAEYCTKLKPLSAATFP